MGHLLCFTVIVEMIVQSLHLCSDWTQPVGLFAPRIAFVHTGDCCKMLNCFCSMNHSVSFSTMRTMPSVVGLVLRDVLTIKDAPGS